MLQGCANMYSSRTIAARCHASAHAVIRGVRPTVTLYISAQEYKCSDPHPHNPASGVKSRFPTAIKRQKHQRKQKTQLNTMKNTRMRCEL